MFFYCPRNSLKMERSLRVCSNHPYYTTTHFMSVLLVKVFILVVILKTITNVIKDSDLSWPQPAFFVFVSKNDVIIC